MRPSHLAYGQTNPKRGKGCLRSHRLAGGQYRPPQGRALLGGGAPWLPLTAMGATMGRAGGLPDNPLPCRGRTFQSTSSGAAYVGGICSLSRGGGVNEVSSVGEG